jgi:uncharacterized protein YebE (UPF0316 family)
MAIFENTIFSIIILPILIFFARVGDVSLGTLRIVFISQGKKKLAPLVGFFEIMIWLLAIGQIFSDLTNFIYYFAYAGGFAIGNYVGLIIEQKISIGLLNLQLIVKENPDELIKVLKEKGYGLTTMTAEGTKGIVRLVLLVIKRKNLPKVLSIIREMSPKAFISIEQVSSVKGGNFPPKRRFHWYLYKRKKV